MEALDPPTLQVVGGWLLIALLFVVREVVSETAKEALDQPRQSHRPARRGG